MNFNNDKRIQTIIDDLIKYSYKYINESSEIEYIYIYASLEDEWWSFYNVYFKICDVIAKKHELNIFSNEKFNVSDDAQEQLIDISQKKLNEIKCYLLDKNMNIPTEIKIIYNVKIRDFRLVISYDKKINDKNSMYDNTEKWYEELKKIV